ncbi:MAG: hypothetical protein PHY43_13875 [Verrucomicrobiales bacterium]|nr:hypothetical protein [Verrucomicrobiales bacterium]
MSADSNFNAPGISAFAKGMTDAFANLRIPAMNYPPIQHIRMPTNEERHKFESAGVMVSRLAARINHWKKQLPQNQQAVVLAVLANGACVNVKQLSQESHHGILIEGDIDGSPCLLLCHQDTLQILCYVEEVKKEEQRREIGFHVI